MTLETVETIEISTKVLMVCERVCSVISYGLLESDNKQNEAINTRRNWSTLEISMSLLRRNHSRQSTRAARRMKKICKFQYITSFLVPGGHGWHVLFSTYSFILHIFPTHFLLWIVWFGRFHVHIHKCEFINKY